MINFYLFKAEKKIRPTVKFGKTFNFILKITAKPTDKNVLLIMTHLRAEAFAICFDKLFSCFFFLIQQRVL